MRRALLSISVIACSGHIELPHWRDEPPPRPCNGAFTWGDSLLNASSATAYLPAQNPGALAFRFTESANACAEVNAGTAGDFLDISIDGAGTQCASCTTSSCKFVYRSQLHAVFVHGADRTELASIVHPAQGGLRRFVQRWRSGAGLDRSGAAGRWIDFTS